MKHSQEQIAEKALRNAGILIGPDEHRSAHEIVDDLGEIISIREFGRQAIIPQLRIEDITTGDRL